MITIKFIGLESLLLLCSSLQADYESFLTRGPEAIKYGNSDHRKQSSKSVGNLFGEKTPNKMIELKNLSAPVSDRRPPDTNDALAKSARKSEDSKKSKKPFVKALKGGNVSKLRPRESEASFGPMTAEEADMELSTEYQSYPHKSNSCYITAPMEVIYASYIRDSSR